MLDRRAFIALGVTAASGAFAAGCSSTDGEPSGSGADTVAVVEDTVEAADPEPAKTEPEWLGRARTAVQALADQAGEGVSVVCLPLARNADDTAYEQQGGSIDIRGDVQRPSASIIKLAILAAAFQSISNGAMALADQITVQSTDIVGGSGVMAWAGAGKTYSVDDVLKNMIAQSDNTAANILINKLGMDAVNACAQSLGLTSTVLARLMMDTDAAAQGRENYTSAADAARVLALAATGQLFGAELSAKAMEYLEAQADTRGIRAGVPAEVAVAHKTGELAYAWHDAAVVLCPQAPFVLGVLTQDMDTATAAEFAQNVASTVYGEASASA